MTLTPAALIAWADYLRGNRRAHLAYLAAPTTTGNPHTTCLAACGRRPVKGSGYCAACRMTWERK